MELDDGVFPMQRSSLSPSPRRLRQQQQQRVEQEEEEGADGARAGESPLRVLHRDLCARVDSHSALLCSLGPAMSTALASQLAVSSAGSGSRSWAESEAVRLALEQPMSRLAAARSHARPEWTSLLQEEMQLLGERVNRAIEDAYPPLPRRMHKRRRVALSAFNSSDSPPHAVQAESGIIGHDSDAVAAAAANSEPIILLSPLDRARGKAERVDRCESLEDELQTVQGLTTLALWAQGHVGTDWQKAAATLSSEASPII